MEILRKSFRLGDLKSDVESNYMGQRLKLMSHFLNLGFVPMVLKSQVILPFNTIDLIALFKLIFAVKGTVISTHPIRFCSHRLSLLFNYLKVNAFLGCIGYVVLFYKIPLDSVKK